MIININFLYLHVNEDDRVVGEIGGMADIVPLKDLYGNRSKAQHTWDDVTFAILVEKMRL